MTCAEQRPRASIILPLTGDPDQALRCLEGIAAQPEEPSFEVIVVDNASAGLGELLARLEGDVEVVRLPRRRSFAAALAAGAARASGETLVVLRSAAAPAPGWLAPLVAALEDGNAGVAVSAAATPVAAWSLATRPALLSTACPDELPAELVFAAVALSAAQRGEVVASCPASRVRPPDPVSARGRFAVGESTELTIVIPTLDALSDRVRACLAAIQAHTDAPHQVIVVDNGSPPQGFAAPVNAGLRGASTPYLVVMNDDVEVGPGWWTPLRTALDAGAAVAFPLTVEGPMRDDFAAWCFALTAETAMSFGHGPGEFFDPALVIWYQDTDLLLALRRAGRPPVLVRESRIRHGLSKSVASDDPELSAWVAVQTAADRRRFEDKHPDAKLHGHQLVAD